MELIYSLIGYPDETEWIEFKSNNNDADRIGKDISALANSAAYHGKDFAYKIWGVEDKTHALIGSSFSYLNARAEGNQYLSIWLATMMSSNASYEFIPVENNGLHFVVLKISAAAEQPVYFKNIAYIREGSSTTHLKPGSKEAELWRRLQRYGFETQAALEDLASADVFELLNTDVYFSLLGLKRPTDSEATFRPLIEQDILKRLDNGRLAITNLGALLLARKVSAFPGLRKRALRIVKFEGKANLSILDDRFFDEGYATALQKAEDYIMTSIPAKELTDGAFRKIQHAYPQAAIRELLVNTVIHQDMTVTTSGPFVSLYDKGLIYRGERIINWCPKCLTSISDAEVEYEEQAGHFWHLRYKLSDGSGYVNLATTRPETLLGDTAIAVNPKDDRYKDIVGKTVILPIVHREIPIVADDYVEMDFGTGVVKITPAHDPNDFEVGARHKLPVINVMTDDAKITEDYPKYAGMDRYEARRAIVKDLEEEGALVKVEDYSHNVGTCYRCKTTV